MTIARADVGVDLHTLTRAGLVGGTVTSFDSADFTSYADRVCQGIITIDLDDSPPQCSSFLGTGDNGSAGAGITGGTLAGQQGANSNDARPR